MLANGLGYNLFRGGDGEGFLRDLMSKERGTTRGSLQVPLMWDTNHVAVLVQIHYGRVNKDP